MTAADTATDTYRQYLLGTLTDVEAAAMDERLFVEPGVADAVALAEDALIAAYLDGRLSARDSARFTAHYLASPVHRERVALVRVLRGVRPVTTSVGAGVRVPAWLAAAAIILLMTGLGWLATQLERGTASAHVTRVAASAPGPAGRADVPLVGQGSPLVTAPEPARQATPITVALLLSAIVPRGDGGNATAVLARDTERVLLQIADDVPADGRLIAEIASVDTGATTRWPVERVTGGVEGPRATVTLPARALPAGDFILTLKADDTQVLRRYSFRVERR